MKRTPFLLFLLIALCPLALISKEMPAEKTREESTQPFEEETVVTQHQLNIGRETLNYTATAGTMIQKDEKGKPSGKIFYVAYTKNTDQNVSTRPITFAFNGGPGSSSVWLHMGVLGPKIIAIDSFGTPENPIQLEDNLGTLLVDSDLVFIDPVSTGLSRPAPKVDEKNFHGVEEDIASVGEFIRQYLTRNDRWTSPKYLIGESYGTTRSAGLSLYLIERYRMYLDGIVLVSPVLNFGAQWFDRGNDLPYITHLPSYTAAAWYHKKLGADLQQKSLPEALKEAERFATGPYTLALLAGDQLEKDKSDQVVKQLSRLTGLNPQYIRNANLRVSNHRFFKELLREDRRTVGRFDSRFLGIDYDAAGECCEQDPTLDALIGPFTEGFNHYLFNNLQVRNDEEYRILHSIRPWNYGNAQNKYLNVADDLREAMTRNRNLKVLVMSGYYDLATPYFAGVYVNNHLHLDPTLRDHLQEQFYDAGHMMYIHRPSLMKMQKDLKEFVRENQRAR